MHVFINFDNKLQNYLSQVLTNTAPRSKTERKVRVVLYRIDVLIRLLFDQKPFGHELVRIRKVLGLSGIHVS